MSFQPPPQHPFNPPPVNAAPNHPPQHSQQQQQQSKTIPPPIHSPPRAASFSSVSVPTNSSSPSTQKPQPLPAANPPSTSSSTEDSKYQQKYIETKKEVDKIDKANSILTVKVARAKKILERLKFERILLMESLEKLSTTDSSENTKTNDTNDQPLDKSTFDIHISSNHKNYRNSTSIEHPRPTFSAPSVTTDDDIQSGDETDAVSVTAPEEPKRKKAKKKDPNAPKRPANSFFLYCQLERENVKLENPTFTRGEITKELGTRWKSMSEDEKKKYYDLYDKDKERYATEMKEYEATNTSAQNTATIHTPAGATHSSSTSVSSSPAHQSFSKKDLKVKEEGEDDRNMSTSLEVDLEDDFMDEE